MQLAGHATHGPGGEEQGEEGDSDVMVETDPEGRFFRSRELVGRGKFKTCHKAFDQVLGIDVAWSKFDVMQVTDEELQAVLSDIQTNLWLDHPNIIKSFKCWEDPATRTINLITELFTSGNLRQYRNHYKQLDLKAVKRMARQILRGLQYLHSQQPPITHGDLRCDKIYVNGNSGEIKIGDIGLATLLPYRNEGVLSPGAGAGPAPGADSSSTSGAGAQPPLPPPCEPSSDIFAFGLCLLELLTLKQLDPQHCSDWQYHLQGVTDAEARDFIARCLSDPRPTADDLLQNPWLQVFRKMATGGEGLGAAPQVQDPGHTLDGVLGMSGLSGQEGGDVVDQGGASGPIAVGKLRGEDYLFEFAGKVRDGKMHFRLVMTQAVQEPTDSGTPAFMRTIDFVFDPDVDTADKLAAEISETFNLSPTDTEICAAALREWLAREMPGLAENGK